MGFCANILAWWHKYKTRRKMERVFSRKPDPFHYRSSDYECARLRAMAEILSSRRYQRALEVGCAEGDFTEKLVRSSDFVTALDISPTALSRARARLSCCEGLEFVEADIRDWQPAQKERFDLIVLADVLYYLDKPLVRQQFESVFGKIASWCAPQGRILLAHAYATPEELAHRKGFRERFEKIGFCLVKEESVGAGLAGTVVCLLSLLESPRS